MWPIRHRVALALLLILTVTLIYVPPAARSQGMQKTYQTYLPLVTRMGVPSIFGFEASPAVMGSSPLVADKARQLGAHWSRMNIISWREVQPTPSRTYNWGALAAFEQDLAANVALKLEPVVIIDDSPAWATILPTACGAIKDDQLAAFAAFMEALVNRYKDRVRYWELGNEPDVDPGLVSKDSVFGCWGDQTDPYYGGERYGRMLNVVAPAIRRADPGATIVTGGLLLDHTNPGQPGNKDPSNFLEGILRANAANSFDVVAYHAYPSYRNVQVDYDLETGNAWNPYGGWTVGKARFIQAIMQRYGVNKPLWLNETGLLCSSSTATCATPAFFQAQADYVVRVMSRAAAEGIQQMSWYTLDGPGWRNAALLDGNQQPRPVYTAYQHLIQRVGQHFGAKATTYSAATEAYRYDKGPTVVDVVWSRSSAVQTISVPGDRFRAAYTRDGAPVNTQPGATIQIGVGFSPIYIERLP